VVDSFVEASHGDGGEFALRCQQNPPRCQMASQKPATREIGILATPALKIRDMMVIIIFGLPGTGKSYFARHLSQEIDAVYLSTDEVRLHMKKQGRYDEEDKQLVYDRLEEMMSEHLKKGENVIIDGTFHEKRRRDQFNGKARELGQPVFFIEMQSREETVKERVEQKREYSEADYSVYKMILNRFEPLEIPHLQLESDRDALEAMTEQARHYIYG